MTNKELKENLIKQYNETIRTLHQLEGAIQVLNQLEDDGKADEEQTIATIENDTTTPSETN